MDDIQNIPSTITGGSDVKEKQSTKQSEGDEKSGQQESPVKMNASELPPHVVLEMPALSPTMVCEVDISFQLSLLDLFMVLSKLMISILNFFFNLQNQGNIATWRKKVGDKVRRHT